MSDTTIEAAQMELTRQLLPLPGVEGTGIGACEGEPCIKVFLARRTDELMKQIPETYRGHRVDVEETGEFRPLPE